MFFLYFSAKHALYQLRDVTQYILALGGLAVSNPGYVVFIIYGGTVVPPCVGMARKQNGGYNASISFQTPLFHLVANCTHPKTVRSALLRCPNTTVALRLLVNVVRATNLEEVFRF